MTLSQVTGNARKKNEFLNKTEFVIRPGSINEKEMQSASLLIYFRRVNWMPAWALPRIPRDEN